MGESEAAMRETGCPPTTTHPRHHAAGAIVEEVAPDADVDALHIDDTARTRGSVVERVVETVKGEWRRWEDAREECPVETAPEDTR